MLSFFCWNTDCEVIISNILSTFQVNIWLRRDARGQIWYSHLALDLDWPHHTPASSYLTRDLGQTLNKSPSNSLTVPPVYSLHFSSKHLQVNRTRCQLRRFLKSVDNILMVKYCKIFIYLCVVIVSNLLCRRGDRVTGRPARSGGAHLGWIKGRFQVKIHQTWIP